MRREIGSDKGRKTSIVLRQGSAHVASIFPEVCLVFLTDFPKFRVVPHSLSILTLVLSSPHNNNNSSTHSAKHRW